MGKIDEQYSQLYNKYIQMATTKSPFQVSNNILTPTMGEMIEEDLSYEALKDINGDTTDNVTKRAYFLDPPFTEKLGYDKDLDAMLIEAPLRKEEYSGRNVGWSWNKYDGDTLYYNVDEVNAGSEPIEISSGRFETFKDYFYSNAKIDHIESRPNFGVRFVGMNCPEVPHFEFSIISKNTFYKKVIKKKIGDIKGNKSYIYWKYPTSDRYNFEQTYRDRDDNEEALFLKTVVDGKTTYNEIVKHKGSSNDFEPTPNEKGDIDSYYLNYEHMKKTNFILPKDSKLGMVEDDVPLLIVTLDETERTTIADGYKAQKVLKDALDSNNNKTTVVLDLKTLTQGTKFEQLGLVLYSMFYTADYASMMLRSMKQTNADIRLSGYSYSAYGVDVYGRYLAAVYTKSDDKWINLNKLVIANSKQTIINPDYVGHPELSNKSLTDAFKLWSYDYNRYQWLDSFEELNSKSYEKRILLHENLSGMKFCEIRDNTVLIGDTLMLIPPTNIRSITQTTYEKIPLLRSKGQITKGGNHNESILELSLFFAGDTGINGIPYKVKLPSGEETTYYMNGLRSLIAQFKLTPFLPIENEYINDVLNIEAVSLLNIEVNTVPEYPQMLQATLIVRAFNYRMFMPDLPLGIEDQSDLSKNALAETNPVFAKAFQWEVFRYYYQRLILAGETIQNFNYNTPEYNEYLYRGVTSLKPTLLCDSNISFYIPDINWLDEALTRKKNADDAIVDFNAIELSQNTRDFAKKIGELNEDIKNVFDEAKKEFSNGIGSSKWINKLSLAIVGKPYTGMPYHHLELTTRLEAKGVLNPIEKFYSPIHNIIERGLLKTGLFSEVVGKETIISGKDEFTNTKDSKVLVWTINAKIAEMGKLLSEKEKSELKEFIAINIDESDKSIILNNDSLTITIHMNIDNRGIFQSVTFNDDLVLNILYNLDKIGNNELTTADQNAIDDEDYNYRDPVKMPFVPLIENVMASEMSISLTNLFTETKLKSVDGISGQYVGGQDSSINIKIVTCDKLVVASLSALPDISFQFATDYKRIMSCTPIRIKSDFTQLYGINEVVVEMIDINTIEEMPGGYEIIMKLSSVDRTARQRESLRKMDFSSNGGFVGKGEAGKQSIKSYFELEDVLSKVELYPDLEIPTLEELKMRGYAYVRYALSNGNRAYPDPDFYMVYANSYSAAIIKAQLKNFFEDLNNPDVDTSNLEEIILSDTETGESFTSKLDETVGISLIGQNKVAELTSKELVTLDNHLSNIEKKNANKKNSKKDQKDTEKALKYLMASNVTDGWKIKPTWSAPLCDATTNDLIKAMPKANTGQDIVTAEVNHLGGSKLKTTRRDIIKIIDAILATPIDMPNNITTDVKSYKNKRQEEQIMLAVNVVVDDFFEKDKNGKKLLSLLNPLIGTYKIPKKSELSTKKYEYANTIEWIKGFIYAAACVNSAEKDYNKKIMEFGKFNGEWGPRMWFNEGTVSNAWDVHTKVYIPLCRVGDANVGLPTENIKNAKEEMMNNAIVNGTVFGPFGIKIYTAEELIAMTTPELNIKYVPEEEYPLYKHSIKTGFIDPYYNALESDSKELARYKKGIMINSKIATEAFLRNTLVWIRKLILDGLFISDIDILADDLLTLFTENNSLFENGKLPSIDSEEDTAEEQIKKVIKAMNDNLFKSIFQNAFEKNAKGEKDISDLYLLYASMCDLLPKSFCIRMIYPILLAATSGSPIIYNDMKTRNYDGLEAAVNSSLSGNVDDRFCKDLATFFNAMAGQSMIDLEDLEKSWTDLSQKMINSVNKEVYLEFSNNPKIYTMHSYYDMLMNDKRGRLVRAFPTYYMILIDEGRKIGHWKLHDNFYNMSSISDIQVIKSRKIAADTATVTMTNAYNSYATEHDNATRYKYADLYGVKDVFDSIFSPKRYYEKADSIRQEAKLKDKVVLKPGVRMHIRMGYSADAARMPVAFNGRITEVNAGEVVNMVAQGDGIETMNPLNNLGNIESNQLDTAQSLIFPSMFTNFRGSWSKGGLSPRNQLASVLCAEYGGFEGIANHFSNGQFFNTNPFGLVHFGDMRYTEIFEQGETAQNLFEVTDDDLLPGMKVIGKDPDTKKTTPIINTSLYDKTFWDLMHISAKAGKDYVAAIRDFGFRSTIFLGQHNHYYAYGYKKVNGNIYEKRKPFQQYHYIEPYNDIIYNTIKASEKDIKTNAVGLWQATNWTFGRKTQTVGPVYLDINIYPEYQKSMTYDTGLLADGNANFDFNPITKIGEGHAFSGKMGQDDKTYDDKVNVKLAERITINALKESVKDMYQGEVCILGSPAIKPHDRIHIFDQQEDMFGDFEVETVIHSLNAYTGFTTTIHPDLIVRHKDNEREIGAQKIITSVTGIIMTSASFYAFRNAFSKTNSKLIKNVMKSSAVSFVSGKLAKTITSNPIFVKNLDKLDSKIVRSIAENLEGFVDDAGNHINSVYMKSIKGLTDSILNLKISKKSSPKDMIKYFKMLEDLDMNTFTKNIDSMIEIAKKNSVDTNQIKDILKYKEEISKSYIHMMNNIDMNEFFEELAKDEDLLKSVKKIDKEMFKYFSERGYKIKDQADIKRFNKIFQSDEILEAIVKGKNYSMQQSFIKGISSAVDFGSDTLSSGGFNGIKAMLTKGIGILDNLVLKITTKPWVTNIVGILLDITISTIIGINTRSIFKTWFDSLQTLTIYPMKQYGINFTAGITGAKACTYSAPPADGWNTIQGMVIQAFETIEKMNPIAKFFVGSIVDSLVADRDEFNKMAQGYKERLGITAKEELSEEDIVEKLYKSISTNMDNYGTSKQAVISRARIQSLDKANENVRTSFNAYAIRNLKPEEIPTNTKISKLVALEYYPDIQRYIVDGRLKLAHSISVDASTINIFDGGKNKPVKVLPTNTEKGLDPNRPDLAMLHNDAAVVLKTILDETYLMDSLEHIKYTLHSATVVNTDDWRSTGFHFILEANDTKATDAFKKAQNVLKSKFKVFEYRKSNGYYTFKIYPPIY